MEYILLVDGDSAARAKNREALMFGGYTVDMAVTGAEALNMLAKKKYNCFLVDLYPPDMDAADLCAEIRRHNLLPPLIALSEPEDTELRVRVGEAADCDAFLQKPCNGRELVMWVDAKMKKYREAVNRIRDG